VCHPKVDDASLIDSRHSYPDRVLCSIATECRSMMPLIRLKRKSQPLNDHAAEQAYLSVYSLVSGPHRVNPYVELHYDGISLNPYEVMFVKVHDPSAIAPPPPHPTPPRPPSRATPPATRLHCVMWCASSQSISEASQAVDAPSIVIFWAEGCLFLVKFDQYVSHQQRPDYRSKASYWAWGGPQCNMP
jgi:hypothetical protein